MNIDITSAGISIKTKKTRRAYGWHELEPGNPVQVMGDQIPWEDVQSALDEAGIDLSSQEMQDKIAAQQKAMEDAEPTEEEKKKTKKRNQIREEVRTTPTPTSMPDLAGRVEKLEILMGLREPDISGM